MASFRESGEARNPGNVDPEDQKIRGAAPKTTGSRGDRPAWNPEKAEAGQWIRHPSRTGRAVKNRLQNLNIPKPWAKRRTPKTPLDIPVHRADTV